ncbi:nucleoside deaminase [Streptomyces sp. NPDC048248]|uniref:nucleoside deaminase n=1 Tax=Streptomyces sp. NPDC048248 TaxID=3365523 RepID=UPI003711ACC4
MTPQTQETDIPGPERVWLQEAIILATTSVTSGGGPFGALIAKDGEVIATGRNEVTTALDPVAHAEVSAMRAACKKLNTFSLAGCVLVTSCEPCPMCLAAALYARVDRLVYSADRDDAAVAGFDDRNFYDLFENQPRSVWPLAVEHFNLPNRTHPFDTWLAKSDRTAY